MLQHTFLGSKFLKDMAVFKNKYVVNFIYESNLVKYNMKSRLVQKIIFYRYFTDLMLPMYRKKPICIMFVLCYNNL